MATDAADGYEHHHEPRANFRYPDSGHMLEDASVLRNALTFTTAQRAYVADSLLHQPLDQMPENVIAFLTLEAFGAEMTAMEDTLSWLFALRDWRPGTAASCLIANLDSIQVGRGDYDERHAIEFLGSLDGSKLREVLHIPSDEALRQAGLGEELIAKVDHSLPYKLDGLRRIAERRSEANRTRVEAFNKLKHGLLAFPTRETDSKVVVQLIKGRGYKQGEIHLNTLTLEVSPANIHNMAGSALAMQAQLWDMLALILWVRFGERHQSPAWAAHSMEHAGWRDD
jgi:hypothetical protein